MKYLVTWETGVLNNNPSMEVIEVLGEVESLEDGNMVIYTHRKTQTDQTSPYWRGMAAADGTQYIDYGSHTHFYVLRPVLEGK